MTVRVFLLENVPSLGKLGDEITVKRGLARGLLFRNNLAVPVNEETRANFEKLKSDAEVRSAKILKEAQVIYDKINGLVLNFEENIAAESDERIFGSVNARQITEKLAEMSGLDIRHNWLSLAAPIKSLGEYNVKVNLPGGMQADIVVVVTGRTQDH